MDKIADIQIARLAKVLGKSYKEVRQELGTRYGVEESLALHKYFRVRNGGLA